MCWNSEALHLLVARPDSCIIAANLLPQVWRQLRVLHPRLNICNDGRSTCHAMPPAVCRGLLCWSGAGAGQACGPAVVVPGSRPLKRSARLPVRPPRWITCPRGVWNVMLSSWLLLCHRTISQAKSMAAVCLQLHTVCITPSRKPKNEIPAQRHVRTSAVAHRFQSSDSKALQRHATPSAHQQTS
jgi:hypothetical protein